MEYLHHFLVYIVVWTVVYTEMNRICFIMNYFLLAVTFVQNLLDNFSIIIENWKIQNVISDWFQRMNLESKSFKAIYRQNGKTWHIWPTSLLIGNITINPSEATTERWRLPTWFSKRSLLSYHVMTDTLDLLHLFMGLLRMYNVRS